MYALKQAVGVLILPSTVAALLFAAGGLILLRGRRRAATCVFSCGVLLAYLSSIPLVGNALLAPLEREHAGFSDDVPIPPAGFVVVLVGFTSSVALVFQAAQQLGATPAQTASWIWALGLGMGLTSIAFSWRWKQPVLIAWSTPGAALIAASSGVSLADATGAFTRDVGA